VAVAQILNYHRCPLAGVGNHTDNWAGDTCGTGTPGTPLTVDLSDAYDWDSMPLACNPPQNCTEEEKAALSELIYEIAVVFDAQFQSCSPGTYAALDPVGLDAHFMYECALGINQRNWYSEEEWFNLIRDELDESRPIYYTYSSPAGSHALVCDGWRQDLVGDQIHLNYGWGSAHDNWLNRPGIPGGSIT